MIFVAIRVTAAYEAVVAPNQKWRVLSVP